MKIKKFEVPYYKWNVSLLIAESHDDCPIVVRHMKAFKIPKESIDDVCHQFEVESRNGGIIFSNESRLLQLVIIYPHDTIKNLVSTLLHEARHATDKIIEINGLDGDEALAYLSQFICSKFIEDYIKEDEVRS